MRCRIGATFCAPPTDGGLPATAILSRLTTTRQTSVRAQTAGASPGVNVRANPFMQ